MQECSKAFAIFNNATEISLFTNAKHSLQNQLSTDVRNYYKSLIKLR